MKNTVLTILFLGIGLLGISQTIAYEYDDAGNRTIRKDPNLFLKKVVKNQDQDLTQIEEEDVAEEVKEDKAKDPNLAQTNNTITDKPTNLEGSAVTKQQEKEGVKDQVGTAEIIIFPNPTKGKLRVNIQGLEGKEKSWLKLYDLTGKILKHKEGLGRTNKVDLTNYQPGIFILKIGANGEETEWKVVRQ